ncbi:serine hydrolase domain-containing protein [Ichthyenterobacterium magnum]|uniref:D-alanyl-D-alanine carboxypeptidase n=1 Tax=Ichthyenterobacterium magnum TaxID=1230530 RepID=A0A420DME8_9FLAO|nr:serine hydrolase domain-containing protein [Ichthyenterobacterium magnum]RKE95357.1 D-alanyl-D-alanine carboxypeptidase [Ichthyenterobacterium magnum]
MKTQLYILFFLSNLIFGQTDSISKIISNKINHQSENPVHSILLYIENENNNFIYNEGFGLTDKNKASVTKHSAFKIASSTKLFVATLILQLQEEGKLNVNDKVSSYLKEIEYLDFENLHIIDDIKYAKDITIEQLLSHRSGLADIFTDREEAFFEMLMQNPNKQYTPKSLIELYYQLNLNREPHFKPNEGWYYSDINYLLLGLIIEQIDKTKLAQSIRNRIIEPLKMENTFFEFYEEPKKEFNQISQYLGQINFSNFNTSFDWSGGGLVSTNSDLAIFIKALFNYKLINQESLTKMVNVKFTKEHESRYGLGVYEFIVNEDVYYGHFGFYNTFVGYCPKTKTAISYSISQATPDFNSYKFISQLLRFVE